MKHSKRIVTLLASLLVLIPVLPGCTSPAEKPAGPDPGEGAAPPPAARAEAAPKPAAAEKEPPPAERPKRPLENARASEWDLCEEVVRALNASDAKALQALRVTESEYRQHLFPEFPATRAGTDTNVDLHWGLLDLKSIRGIAEAIDKFGGHDLELLDIIVDRVDAYPTYHLLNKVLLKVRRKLDGAEAQIRVFGSILELDGQYKILGFPS